jgi:predicted dinucleotide-binding enzyme
MKIGILGGTKLALALGNKYLDSGLKVSFGVREEFEIKEIGWKILNMFLDKVLSIEEAIDKSDIIFICCENEYLTKIIAKLKSVNLEGKILIDCTNSALYKVFDCNTTLIRSEIKEVPIFKAFNNLGLDYPKNDLLGVVKETYFCGENGIEKSKVKRLIELIGYRAIDSGGLDNALLLEAFYHLRKEIMTNKNEQSDYHFKLISC